MANLWRTQRPRFPLYISDGNGRDYYIKYNNAGYWDDQFKIIKKPDYEYPKFNNFHSLFHQAAPVKYKPTGKGRETYIINALGQYHDQRPIASYKLDEFLRESNTIPISKKFKNRKHYMSVGEKRYNNQLKLLEKKLINRLYNIPKKVKKDKKKEENVNIFPNLDNSNENLEDEKKKNEGNEKIYEGRLNTIGSMPHFRSNYLKRKKKFNKLSLNNNLDSILKQSQDLEKYEMKNKSRRGNNKTDYNIYKNGRVGCRLNGLKLLMNSQSENFKYRINTEGNKYRNKYLSLEKPNKKIKAFNHCFSYAPNSEENHYKTYNIKNDL